MELTVSWTEMKALIDTLQVRHKYIDFGTRYEIIGLDGSFVCKCYLDKSPADTTDLTDFETNYKTNNLSVTCSTPSGVTEPNNFRARMKGLGSLTVTAGTTADLDYKMEQLAYSGTNKNSYFDGVQYFAESAKVGDYVKFQVVDKDGISYPAGTVLEEFGDQWYIMPDAKTDIRLFKSKLIPDMYIRIKYTSTGTTDVTFVGNLFRFIKTDENS